MKVSTYLSVAALALAGLTASAQKPLIERPMPGSNVIIDRISDNGKWGVAQVASSTDGDLRPIGGTIFDLTTYKTTPVTHPSGLSGISDISDDGEIVVGECNGVPAYWTKSTGEWTIPTLKELTIEGNKMDIGRFNAVTPDGQYAAGYRASTADYFLAYPLVYDIKEGKEISLPGLPVYDQSHVDRHENALYHISPDGRYVTGMLSQAFLKDEDYAPLCSYVYDIQTGTYDMIGFNDYLDKNWEPLSPNLLWVSGPVMSNNGKWITGTAYSVEIIPGTDWPKETYLPFRYNVETKEFNLYSADGDMDIVGSAIDNDGVVYGHTPASNPYASCVVRSGDYFINLDQIFGQIYGFDFYSEAPDFGVTGKPLSISNDCKTLIMLPNTETTYVLKMPESLAEAASKVKLLGNYSVSPAEGVKLSKIFSFTLTFDRNIKVTGRSSDVKFESADGSVVYNPLNSGLKADANKLIITFMPQNLEEGVDYTLTIPEGTVAMVGNETETNAEIRLNYKGRDNKPVKVLSIVPEDGAYVQMLDLTSNPIMMEFDADLKLKEGALAELYRNDEAEPYCVLNMSVQGKNLFLFPTSGQYLYLDSEYHIVIPAKVLTDISGGGENEEISFTYQGAYERQIHTDDKNVFSDDCSAYANMMFYEGDKREPISEMAEWGFTAETTPWLTVRDDNDTNMAFASHSMYKPAGQSDDWVVIPQLLIPNENTYLEFLGQSYLNAANDVLDIYIYASDNVYNTLNSDIINDIRTKGDHVFSERLTPGSQQDILADDWKTYRITLEDYAKKNIYIAFANQNKDQSAIFIDDIRVINDTPYVTKFDTPARVVKQEKVPVSGYMLFESDLHTYSDIHLELTDADGNTIDTIEEKGLSLTKGSQYNFRFKEELPLTVGEITTYYVEVTLDNEAPSKMTGKVANLSFQPNRRVVLEEYTGRECGNCPQGIRAMENIEMLYPGVMIPIAIRTYESDPLGNGMNAYSQALGLDQLGAPSATIDRKEAGYSMINYDGDYRFSGKGVPNSLGTGDERLWLDMFRDEYESPAEIGIIHSSSLNADKTKATVKVHVSSALNKYRTGYKVFAVITEDGLITYQQNYMSSVEDPDLGEWGKGGEYGKPVVMPVTANHVARQTWGTTYNGTAGRIPANLKAGFGYDTEFTVDIPETISNTDNCHMIVMILDETNQVLNANVSPLNGSSDTVAVDTVFGDSNSVAGMAVIDGTLHVNAAGAFSVAAYDLAGSALLNAKGEGFASFPLHGYKGVLIVKATDAEGNVKSAKFIVR